MNNKYTFEMPNPYFNTFNRGGENNLGYYVQNNLEFNENLLFSYKS